MSLGHFRLSHLAQIMEQVEGGDLVVNKGKESKPRQRGEDVPREMNAVESIDEALRLAKVIQGQIAIRKKLMAEFRLTSKS